MEQYRSSYENWPGDIDLIERLLEAGFQYKGETDTDKVECVYCGGQLSKWTRFHVPWWEHYKWFRNCKWVKYKYTYDDYVKGQIDSMNINLNGSVKF